MRVRVYIYYIYKLARITHMYTYKNVSVTKLMVIVTAGNSMIIGAVGSNPRNGLTLNVRPYPVRFNKDYIV